MRWLIAGLLIGLFLTLTPVCTQAMQAEPAETAARGPAAPRDGDGLAAPPPAAVPRTMTVWQLLEAGGTIGWVIMVLSVAYLALMIEHFITVRTSTLMPKGLAEECYKAISQGQYKQADQHCQQSPSFLASVIAAGLPEVPLGYEAVEKAMEDMSLFQTARLFRKIEYFTVIGTIAPMLGLLGTVWGMILAFMEFENKPNPLVSELAPGVYKALVTTLQGLCVAIPALATYAVLRNRVEELASSTALMAEQVFSNFKRTSGPRRTEPRKTLPAKSAAPIPFDFDTTTSGEEE